MSVADGAGGANRQLRASRLSLIEGPSRGRLIRGGRVRRQTRFNSQLRRVCPIASSCPDQIVPLGEAHANANIASFGPGHRGLSLQKRDHSEGTPDGETDIEIARAAKKKPIMEIGAKLGIPSEHLLPYGATKAKVSAEFITAPKSGKGRQADPRHRHQPDARRRRQDHHHRRPRATA